MKIKLFNLRSRGGGAKAFTVAEVVIGVAILAIMVVTVFSGYTMGWALIHTARDDLRATQILTQKIESIRLLTWSQLTNDCPNAFIDYYNPSGASSNALGTVYYGTISVTPPTNILWFVSYRKQVRLVTVGVSWTNLYGQTPVAHHRQMQTLSALNGMQNYIWGNYK